MRPYAVFRNRTPMRLRLPQTPTGDGLAQDFWKILCKVLTNHQQICYILNKETKCQPNPGGDRGNQQALPTDLHIFDRLH